MSFMLGLDEEAPRTRRYWITLLERAFGALISGIRGSLVTLSKYPPIH